MSLLLLLLGIWCVFVAMVPLFRGFFGLKARFRAFCYRIAKNIVQMFLLCLGVVRVKVNGEAEPNARMFVSNHVSPLDYIVHFYGNLVAFASIGDAPSLMIKMFSPIFDLFQFKKKKLGYQIHNCASDPTVPPLLIFPEEKETNGQAVAPFEKEAFKTDYIIQPVSIQYHIHLTPKGFNTVSRGGDPYLRYFFRILSIPYLTVELTYLNPFDIKYCQLDIEAKAQKAQLQIANQIGVLAIAKQ